MSLNTNALNLSFFLYNLGIIYLPAIVVDVGIGTIGRYNNNSRYIADNIDGRNIIAVKIYKH